MRETDLAIVGAGAAGLTAAAAAARAGLRVLVVERMGAGGQVMNVDRIDNFPGHPQGIPGYELGPLLQEQAEDAGAEFALDTVLALDPELAEGRRILRCEGEDIAARAVLIACGSQRRPLGVPGEAELAGRGVSHCASCDGPLFRGETVCVVGGGDSAAGEALALSFHAAQVVLVHRGAQPHAQAYLLEALRATPNVQIVDAAEVTEITSDTAGVTGVTLREPGATRHLPARGVFPYAGLVADTGFLGGALQLDAQGRIACDAQFGTSLPGVFAAGDARAGAAWLLSAAAEEGALAAASAARYLQEQK